MRSIPARDADADVEATTSAVSPLPTSTLVAYGAYGAPLAMAALPLHVHLPAYYAGLGVGLGTLGALLLAMRATDALLDPLIGALSDRGASRRRLVRWATWPLAVGMVALFSPPAAGPGAMLAWLAGSLAIVYFAFSVAAINHAAWGAEIAADPNERTRVTAARESLALGGVIVASVAPSLLADRADDGLQAFALVFAATVLLAAVSLRLAPDRRPAPRHRGDRLVDTALRPMRDPRFRSLLAVFVVNGIASAVPATLVLFYVDDVLRMPERQGVFLALYFVAGAAGMPVWIRAAQALGKRRAWQLSMIVAIAAFGAASVLRAGDGLAFATICVASGLALGADLALPPSMLADVVGRRGAIATAGPAFGLWTLATKLNLAVAAGVALPLVAALGYVPGNADADARVALAFVYAVVPCALKALAALLLARVPDVPIGAR